jgi:hypothetical protein
VALTEAPAAVQIIDTDKVGQERIRCRVGANQDVLLANVTKPQLRARQRLDDWHTMYHQHRTTYVEGERADVIT